MMDFSSKKHSEIESWIKNHEDHGQTNAPLYIELLEERARRTQEKQILNLEVSLSHLRQAAIEQRCTTYGALANASGVEWSKVRHQMNGVGGHLDRLLDLCHARKLPMLPAICVNQSGLQSGELEESALTGFATGAQRLGISVIDARAYHHQCRNDCWEWGRQQKN
jgi:hypothetical protein